MFIWAYRLQNLLGVISIFVSIPCVGCVTVGWGDGWLGILADGTTGGTLNAGACD